MKKALYWQLIAFLFLSESVFAQNKIYVDHMATGNNNGSSWLDAYTSLAIALKCSDTALYVDSILIAEGTYKPEFLLDTTKSDQRYKGFKLTRGEITLLGGFSSGGVSYNPRLYRTILSGNVGNVNDSTDNSYFLFFIKGIMGSNLQYSDIHFTNLEFSESYGVAPDNSVIIDGFLTSSNGSALSLSYAEVFIDNCIFQNNYNHSDGSAIYCLSSDGVFVNNSLFRNNHANLRGGAVYHTSNMHITNSRFENNSAGIDGDAIFASYPEGLISNNLFINHKSNGNSILYFVSSLRLNFSNNIIMNNWTNVGNNRTDNSILYVRSAYVGPYIIPKVTNNLFVNNVTKTILFDAYVSTDVVNNIIFDNQADSIVAQSDYMLTRDRPLRMNYFHNDTSYSENINGYLDPMFVKYDTVFENADFRLQFCSPLLNIGDTSVIFPTTDFMGNQRVVGSRIDIGPIEKQSFDSIAINVALAQESDNNMALIPICEEDDWTYYTSSNNVDSVFFAIKWDSANVLAKANALVNIKVDSTLAILTNGTDTGLATIPRSWEIDLGSDSLIVPISIRFYYSEKDIEKIITFFNYEGLDSVSPIQWFVMDESFNPNVHLSYNGINNGNILLLSPIVRRSRRLSYVQFDSLWQFESGSAYVSASNKLKPNRIGEYNMDENLVLMPNPTNDVLNVTVFEASLIGRRAHLLDIFGRVLHSFDLLKHNQLNYSHLPAGVYLIQIGNSCAAKFVKK